MAQPSEAAKKAIQAVWRVESTRLIGGLLRLVEDVGLAEDLAHDALIAALERWPTSGIPENPGAWLMATAKHRGIDELRRRRRVASGDPLDSGVSSLLVVAPSFDEALDDKVGDDVLRLIFVACHPLLSSDARVALTLRLLGGLSTLEISRAYLVPEPTIAQRIVRAKRTLTEAHVPFEVPHGPELVARLPSVLEVVYLIFNEGYAATRGEEWLRPDLCNEALRLGRILAELVPHQAEVHGLVALMELHASRARARVADSGEPILLLEQDRARWDRLLIRRGLTALARAEALGKPLGPYTLQAAISACHARALTAQQTDWPRIVALYDALVESTHSAVVELNRAVAVSMAFGPAEALTLVEELSEEPALRGYHLLPAVRGDLLDRLGRKDEACAQFELAALLTSNEREKALLRKRAAGLRSAEEKI